MTDILKSFSTLQCELDVAKTTLKGVDENIKRLIGRDPSELTTRPPAKKNNSQNDERLRPRGIVNQNEERRFKNTRMKMFVQDNEEPPIKKRTTGISVFKRLSDRPVQDDDQPKQLKGMISKVIVTPKEIPSRQERMNAQSKDATSIARNRRMFGALMGTLQKFQQEETKLKKKEDKRAQLEKKIEEHEIKEKEEIKKERQELFFNRKKKQAEIKMIELKMIRMKEYSVWEEAQKHRMNFIYTKTKPQIHFQPRKLNEAHKVLLESSRTEILNMIDKKREQVQAELMHIEERGKRIFEPRRFNQENKEQDNDERDHQNGLDDEDVTMEDLHHREKECDSSVTVATDNLADNNTVENDGKKENQEIENEENSQSEKKSQYLAQKIDNIETCSNDDVNIVNDSIEQFSLENYSNQSNVIGSSTHCNQQVSVENDTKCNDHGQVDVV